MTSHIEKIRAACIKANPEIAELQQGCKLVVAGKEKEVWAWMFNPGAWLLSDNRVYSNEELTLSKVTEILGRPIRLADVLLAIPSKEPKDDWFVDTRGDFWHHGHFVFTGWNLREDDLEKQTPETLAFIADLL